MWISIIRIWIPIHFRCNVYSFSSCPPLFHSYRFQENLKPFRILPSSQRIWPKPGQKKIQPRPGQTHLTHATLSWAAVCAPSRRSTRLWRCGGPPSTTGFTRLIISDMNWCLKENCNSEKCKLYYLPRMFYFLAKQFVYSFACVLFMCILKVCLLLKI